jgi:subtilisin family serine protease
MNSQKFKISLSIFTIVLIVSILLNPVKKRQESISHLESQKVIVKFKNSVDNGFFSWIKPAELNSKNIQELLCNFKIDKLESVFSNRYQFGGILRPDLMKYMKEASYRKVTLPDTALARKFISEISKEEGVEWAFLEKPILLKPFMTTNDPEYANNNQWYLNSPSNPNSDIHASQAWDINRGRNDVIIAVCDGGVDYTHADLDPGNRSRVIAGYDFGNNDNNPMDDLPSSGLSYGEHGTHIAGIIGAITNNGMYVSGIMWNCKIMPVKMVGSGAIKSPFGGTILDFSTTALPGDVANSIDYAVNNGANIINLSYGFSSVGFPIDEIILRIPLLYETISNAYNNNVVITAAIGNEYNSGNPVEYPAGFSHEVIAVGATTESFTRWSNSNTGPHIDLSAPGTNIISTLRGSGTTPKTGTSMAAPVVAGIAGLVISLGKDRNLNLTNDDVEHIMEQTADDMGTTGFDEATGYGKVNAYSALSLINSPNNLYHASSVGGTSTKIATLAKWVYLGGWNLSAGTYLSVDQYQITKHVNFNVPFCTTPKVWLRERQSICLSFANPNDGFPWAEITNVTSTGFDVRYAAYFIKYNLLGQTINKWIPAQPASTKIEFTSVGLPNLTATAGPITGPTLVCSSSNGTYVLSNLPSGTTVSWTPSTNLTYVSGQGTTSYVVRGTSTSGTAYVKATISPISGGCGSTTIQYNLWVGPPAVSVTGPSEGCVNNTFYFTATPTITYSSASNYTWDLVPLNGNYLQPYGFNNNQCAITFYNPYSASGYTVEARAQNSCGIGGYGTANIWVHTCYTFTLSPNPASETVTVTKKVVGDDANFSSSILSEDSNTIYTIRIIDFYGALHYTATKSGDTFSFPIASLKDGSYIVQITNGKDVYNLQLVVKH